MKYIYYKMQIPGDTDAVKLSDVRLSYSESHLAIAQKEAYHGEYTVVDDGMPEPVAEPTTEERIAELEEALELLLSGVTE